jgi:hypothetical protein
MRGIRLKDLRPITRALSVQKNVSENTVLCIIHNFVCNIHSVIKHNTTHIKKRLPLNPPKLSFRANGHTKKVKVEFSS